MFKLCYALNHFCDNTEKPLIHGNDLLPPLSLIHCILISRYFKPTFPDMCHITAECMRSLHPPAAAAQRLSQLPNCPDPNSVVLSWDVTESWTQQRHHTGSKASIASFRVPGSTDTLRCPDRSELFRWHKEIKWKRAGRRRFQSGVYISSQKWQLLFFMYTFKCK